MPEPSSRLTAGDVLPLWPAGPSRPLAGLYLEHDLRAAAGGALLIYANFVASLDGRIALDGGVPREIANPRDWRLFCELAVQADAMLVSGQHLRARAQGAAQDLFAVFHAAGGDDLRAWRVARGLPAWPHIVVLSRAVDWPLPPEVPPDRVLLLTDAAGADSAGAARLRASGAEVRVAGHVAVESAVAAEILSEFGLSAVYAVGGAHILRWLAAGGLLARLYLTQVHRLLGGDSFTGLIEGARLSPPYELRLHRVYYDSAAPGVGGQLYCCYQGG